MTTNDRELRSMQMHAEVAARLQNDPAAFHNARFSTEAAGMVTAAVPRRNREVFQDHEWLDRIVALYAFADYPGWTERDPLFITERDGEHRPLPEDLTELPVPPLAGHCAYCQDWDNTAIRAGIEAYGPVQAVEPVRLSRGMRVVEILLCGSCVARFSVEPSHA